MFLDYTYIIIRIHFPENPDFSTKTAVFGILLMIFNLIGLF